MSCLLFGMHAGVGLMTVRLCRNPRAFSAGCTTTSDGVPARSDQAGSR